MLNVAICHILVALYDSLSALKILDITQIVNS